MEGTVTYLHYEKVDSTNDEAKRLAGKGASEYTVVSADCQIRGRGRRGRQWESEAGMSVYTSMLLYPDLPANAVSAITLTAAVAVRRAIALRYPLEPVIKWPNDIVLDGKKVCGILSEHFIGEGGRSLVVVGIGINLYQRDFPSELAGRAVSIAMALENAEGASGRKEPAESEDGTAGMEPGEGAAERERLTETVWENFCECYERLCRTGDLSLLKDEYERYLINRNRQVEVQSPSGICRGTAVGIDALGGLLVDTEGGRIRVDSGEVSVRGVYGYV